MEIKKIRELYREICNAITNIQIICVFGRIKKSKKITDEAWYEERVILIDIRNDIVDSILHEGLHFIRPTWDHRHILPRTKKMLSILKMRELHRLMKLAADVGVPIEGDWDVDEDISHLWEALKPIIMKIRQERSK